MALAVAAESLEEPSRPQPVNRGPNPNVFVAFPMQHVLNFISASDSKKIGNKDSNTPNKDGKISFNAINSLYQAESLLLKVYKGTGSTISPQESVITGQVYTVSQSIQGGGVAFTLIPKMKLSPIGWFNVQVFKLFADAIGNLVPTTPIDGRRITGHNGKLTITGLPRDCAETLSLMQIASNQIER